MPSTAFSLLPVCLRPCRGVPGDYTAQEGAVAAYTHQPDALFIKQVERVSVTLPPPPPDLLSGPASCPAVPWGLGCSARPGWAGGLPLQQLGAAGRCLAQPQVEETGALAVIRTPAGAPRAESVRVWCLGGDGYPAGWRALARFCGGLCLFHVL